MASTHVEIDFSETVHCGKCILSRHFHTVKPGGMRLKRQRIFKWMHYHCDTSFEKDFAEGERSGKLKLNGDMLCCLEGGVIMDWTSLAVVLGIALTIAALIYAGC